MSRKVFAQASVLMLLLLAFFGTPAGTQAGGACGGSYVVESGDTVDTIAAMCGTSTSAIYAANPGISGNLYVGQVLMIPGSAYNYNYDYNYYNYYNYYTPSSYNSTHIVQAGDTFSNIASRYGVSYDALVIANPQVIDLNSLYIGQVIYIPTSTGQTVYPYPVPATIVPTPTQAAVPLSYGTAPAGTRNGTILLSNKANGGVYVSLQGTMSNGSTVINEYPVSGTMSVKVPAGWYDYVAWVGGQKFEGSFKLGGDSEHSMTFYSNKVVVK